MRMRFLLFIFRGRGFLRFGGVIMFDELFKDQGDFFKVEGFFVGQLLRLRLHVFSSLF